MTMLIWDVETRSECDLKHEGSYKYAQHPSTVVLCVAYCVDEGFIKLWKPGDGVPPEFMQAAKDKTWTSVAHNHQFESLILRFVLSKQGWPIIPLERTVCTMANAHAMALPGSLEKVATVCNMRYQKDKVGHRIMLQVTKPRNPRKDEDPNGVYWFDDSAKLGILYKYCKLDVAATREIAYALPWLSDEEQAVWHLDQRINNQGLFLDDNLMAAAENIIEEANAYIVAQITRLTNGQVTSINQAAKLKAWVQQFVPGIKNLQKDTIDDLLEVEGLPDPARKALELRQLGAQAAPKKVKALTNRREKDGRVRGAFVYHAAGTGRWSSRGAQLHNMKRSQTDDIEAAIRVIRTGSFKEASKAYDQPLAVIGDVVRSMVSAPPGYVLIGADFSGIEARVTAWLADEQRALDAFLAYDNGTGPDPYIIAAAEIFSIDATDLERRYKAKEVLGIEQRQLGKAGVLAFGFGGGVNAYKRFLPSSINLSDDEIEKIKNAWRAAHPNIVALWQAIKSSTWGVIKGQRDCDCGKLSFYNDRASNMVGMVLPSGRHLAYPQQRVIIGFKHKETGQIIETPKGRPMIVMKDNSGNRWRDVSWWYGITMENAVQAIARDLLAEAMVRIDKAGLTIVGHVHDSIYIEVKKQEAEAACKKFMGLMLTLPPWAGGLPLAAKPEISERMK